MVGKTNALKIDQQTRIVNAASEIFLENGFELSSTAEIAKRAKVSKRELYTNYVDKRALLAAVITQLQEDVQAQMNIRWSSSDDVREVLIHAGNEILAFVSSTRFGKLFRIVATQSFRDQVSAQRFYLLGPGMGRKQTADFIRRQMRIGNLRKAEPLQAADDFLDLIVSARYLTSVVLGQEFESIKKRKHVKHAVDLFLRFYGPETVMTGADNQNSGSVAMRLRRVSVK